MFKLSKILVLAFITGVASFFLFSGTSQAATISVDSLADTQIQDDGDCTLREAIANVNAAADTTDGGGGGDCVAGDGSADTIAVPAGDILLSADLTAINTTMVIQGAGVDQTTIDGNNGQFAVFAAGDNISLAVTDLKITAFSMAAIGAPFKTNTNITVARVEIDGTNANTPNGLFAGIGLVLTGATTNTLSLTDVYVHDITTTTPGVGISGIVFGAAADGTINATLNRVTVSNLSTTDGGLNAVSLILGTFSSGSPGTVNATMDNITIDDIHSDTGLAFGLATTNAVTGGTSLVDMVMTNATVTGVTGAPTLTESGAFKMIGAASQVSDSSTTSLELRNVLVAGNSSNGAPANCDTFNANAIFSGVGSPVMSITSAGGNISDDTTCTSYLNQSTDQNNVTALIASLETLADNGGYAHTRALLEGSPAVDGGVTAMLAEDARGQSRPAGATYDVGAYESGFTAAQDLSVTKQLVTTGNIQAGDTVEYRITVQNVGSATTEGFGGFIDMFSPELEYLDASGSVAGDCFVLTPQQAVNDGIAAVLPNHANYGVVTCGNVPYDLASGSTLEFTLRFKVKTQFTQFSNYVFERWGSGDEDDSSYFESTYQPGDDIIDMYTSGSMMGVFNNMSGVTYTATSNGQLAASGRTIIATTGLTTAAAGAALYVAARRRSRAYSLR